MASKDGVFSNPIVKDYLEELGGPDSIKVAKALPVTKLKSEYEVADDIKININKIRSVLYKFYSKNLVVYNRQRDAKKGWYIYHWQFFPDKLVSQIIADKQALIDDAEPVDAGNGEEQVYVCSNCGSNHDFNSAFNNDFLCPNCRIALKTVDAKKIARESNKEKKKVEKEIAELKKLL